MVSGDVMRQLSALLIFLSCLGAAGASESTLQRQTVVAQADDRSKAPVASPDDAGRLVALVLAAPEVSSLSQLAGKNIAIDDTASGLNDQARRKLETAVSAKVDEGQAKALDRLVSREVPAVVLSLAYPETAEWSSEIAGFKVFRIPLLDRSVTPANPVVPDTPLARTPMSPSTADARAEIRDPKALDPKTLDPKALTAAEKVRAQMRVATVIAEHVMTLRDAEKKASSSPNNAGPSVAVVVASPEIKSVSDLAGKFIAIDDKYLNAHARIQAAIATAGATGSQLAIGETLAMDRLINGFAPAAVLTLVYPETAISTIDGYSVFRVPLEADQPNR
jgi:hypothetical protein